MGHALEQADGTSRTGAAYRRSSYHRWLKRGRARYIRRQVKQALHIDAEPPKVGYRGYET